MKNKKESKFWHYWTQGWHQIKFATQIKCCRKTVYNVKKSRIIERKQRNDIGKSRTIDERMGKILKKRLYGKRGVGLKKLGNTICQHKRSEDGWVINLGVHILYLNSKLAYLKRTLKIGKFFIKEWRILDLKTLVKIFSDEMLVLS